MGFHLAARLCTCRLTCALLTCGCLWHACSVYRSFKRAANGYRSRDVASLRIVSFRCIQSYPFACAVPMRDTSTRMTPRKSSSGGNVGLCEVSEGYKDGHFTGEGNGGQRHCNALLRSRIALRVPFPFPFHRGTLRLRHSPGSRLASFVMVPSSLSTARSLRRKSVAEELTNEPALPSNTQMRAWAPRSCMFLYSRVRLWCGRTRWEHYFADAEKEKSDDCVIT